jgi:hypothetical protein
MKRTLPIILSLLAMAWPGRVLAAQPSPASSQEGVVFTKGAALAAGWEQNPACRAAKRYRDLLAAGQYDQVGGLFAQDALYLGPGEEPIHGAERIGTFYKKFMALHKPTSFIGSLVPVGDHDCYMELQATADTDSPAVIDRFTTDKAGKVIRLCVYSRPGRAKILGAAAAAAMAQ